MRGKTMSRLTRRSFVAGSTAAAVAFTLRAPAFAAGDAVYRNAIVIDGLGGLGNSETEGPLTDAQVQDIRDCAEYLDLVVIYDDNEVIQ